MALHLFMVEGCRYKRFVSTAFHFGETGIIYTEEMVDFFSKEDVTFDSLFNFQGPQP